ncbi:MAG: YhfC family glutamic-type intramembrane protease [Clostridiales bacterium]|nr:YhfC family glutamic-type intramembrane protease [Clostridiales bacterium]
MPNNDLIFSQSLINGMLCVVVVCIMLPVFYLIFYTFKKKIHLPSVLMGIVGFFIFGYILSGLLLGNIAPKESAADSPMLYTVLRSVCVAIAEGGGAFAAMYFLRRKYDEISTPISYALGYPLVNMLLVGGANSFVRMAEAYTVNVKGLDEVLASVEGEAVEVLRQDLFALAETEPYVYFLSAVDYICIFCIFVAICRIMWYAAHEEGRSRMILLAAGVVFKLAAEFPVAFYQAGGTENYIVCEVIRYVVTALCVGFAVLMSFKYDDKERVSAGPLNRRLL